MKELQIVLDEFGADARVDEANWSDVVARSRRATTGYRSRRTLVLALAAVILISLASVAIAAEFDLLTQQEQFHDRTPDDPARRGQSVQVAASDNWALIAWHSEAGLCLDFAIADNSTFSCGLPVRGAMPAADANERSGHAVAGSISGGNLVGGDGRATIFGATAPEVARVVVELANGRLVVPHVYDAPPNLDAEARFFIARLRLDELERGLDRESPVRAYEAYDSDGRLIERVED